AFDRGRHDADAAARGYQPQRGLQFLGLSTDYRFDACIPVERENLIGVARPRRFRINDQVLICGCAQPEFSFPGRQLVPPRHHDAETFFADNAADDRLVVEAEATETYIDAAILQRRDLFQCSHLQKIYFCAGCDDAETADQLRQRVVQGRSDEADVELQHHALGDSLGHRTHFVNPLQYLASLFEQISAWFCQREWPTPVEQPYPEFVLKLLHLTA